MKELVKFGVIFGTAAFLTSAFGGTVVTDNLPANTAIVNINANADGANGYGGGHTGQTYWYRPFNLNGTLLEYTVQAGTYNFRVINPADAAQLFSALTTDQTNQIYTAWTYNSPWIEDYLVFDSAAATNNSLAQIFDGAGGSTNGAVAGFANANQAYNDAVTNHYVNVLRLSADGGRESTNLVTSYTFTNTATLIFVVPDYALGDNAGGVSVLISPANLAPVLSITTSANTATLQWPTNFSGFILAETTNLQNAIWNDEVSSPTIVNSNYSITVPLGLATNIFFRLHSP